MRSPVLTKEELSEGFAAGDHDHWELLDGLLDGPMQAQDVDAREVNGGIMAMVKEVKGKIAPDSMAALEMFDSVISDPVEEESGQVGDSSRGPEKAILPHFSPARVAEA